MVNITSATFVKGVVGDDAVLHDGKPQVAFVGRSNVGKSSLINALTKRNNLVKVSSTPGKTTEINFFLINKQWYLVDLPGYGYARVSPKEKEVLLNLIRNYLTAPHIRPKVVAVVVDCKVGITAFDAEMLELLRKKEHPAIIAANKIDALSQKELSQQLRKITEASYGAPVIPCSAKNSFGITELLNALFHE